MLSDTTIYLQSLSKNVWAGCERKFESSYFYGYIII